MDKEEARELTEKIKNCVSNLTELILQAWDGRAWLELGYKSWNLYCQTEFGGLALGRESRREYSIELSNKGLSTRAIGAALGVSEGTARNDLKTGAQNYAPEPGEEKPSPELPNATGKSRTVTGTDGKLYPKPITDSNKNREAKVRAQHDQAQAKFEERNKTTYRHSFFSIASSSLDAARKELLDALKNAKTIDFNFTEEEKQYWNHSLNKVIDLIELLKIGSEDLSSVDWDSELEGLV